MLCLAESSESETDFSVGSWNDPTYKPQSDIDDFVRHDTNINDIDIDINIDIPTSEEKTPSRWKQRKIPRKEKLKIKRNLGKSYTRKNKKVEARRLGNPCNCKQKCREKLQDNAINIFSEFWSMGDYNTQNAYLFSLLQVKTPKRRYPKKQKRSDISRRHITVEYYVKLNGENVKICKNEFLAVHGLQNSKGRIEHITNQIIDGVSIPKSDKRGKHSNRPNKYSEAAIISVHDHICSIPKYTSHYSRTENPGRVYLNSDLSLSRLYTDYYVPWCEERHLSPVSSDKYQRIFGYEYNIGFKLPRSDTCKMCDNFHMSISNCDNNEDARKMRMELELHQKRSKAVQDFMKEKIQDAKNGITQVITFDLQQALPTPMLTTSIAFYLRKMWTYNFGIHECGTGKGYMNVWSERTAARGAEEIASVLFGFFKTHTPTSKELIMFSDNCGGQNKNWLIMSLWSQMVKQKLYERIEHWFLVPGHTFLPSDRDFAVIEKYKRKISHVYTTDDWLQIIKKAKRQNPFDVKIVKEEDFYTFESVSDNISKKLLTDEKSKVDFSNVRCFMFDANQPEKIFIKHFMNEEFKSVTVAKRGRSSKNDNLLLDNLPTKYNGQRAIDKKKLADIKKMMPYIPLADQPFYTSLKGFSEFDEMADSSDLEPENLD